MNDVFLELSLVVVVVLLVSLVMRLLRQPLIIGYILAGLVVGPTVLNLVHSNDAVDLFAHFGVALLLFIIGLGLNPRVIREIGKVAALTGISQVIITTIVGWGLAMLLGYDQETSLYLAIALTFSSTIIVLKLLSDKREQHRLHGKISIGFLLVQDVCAAILLIIFSALNQDALSLDNGLFLIWKIMAFILALWIASVKILPRCRRFVTDTPEFLFIFAIAWGFGGAALFYQSGLSLEVGALAAGVALANQNYTSEIASRLRPLRDFFLIMFFVGAGAHLELGAFGSLIPQALILSSLVLIGNPLIVMGIMGWLGFKKKVSFKAGLAVAQISEFSLIFIAVVIDGDTNPQIINLVTLIALITIVGSSYMIIYSDQIYNKVQSLLKVFERKQTRSPTIEGQASPELLLVGYAKGGEQFIKGFSSFKEDFLVVDYNPAVIEHLEHDNIPCLYGDITDIEFVNELPIDRLKLVVSVLSDFEASLFLVKQIVVRNPDIIVVVSADRPDEAVSLYGQKASYVMMPHYVGSQRVLSFLKKAGLNDKTFQGLRQKHILALKNKLPKQTKHRSRHLGQQIFKIIDRF